MCLRSTMRDPGFLLSRGLGTASRQGGGQGLVLKLLFAFEGDLDLSWTPKQQQNDLLQPCTWARRWPGSSQPGHGSLTPGRSAVWKILLQTSVFLLITAPAACHSVSWSPKAPICSLSSGQACPVTG